MDDFPESEGVAGWFAHVVLMQPQRNGKWSEATAPLVQRFPEEGRLHAFHAAALMRDAARPVTRIETVSLESAHRRVLASPIVAGQDVPPFTRAAMDGYAVIAEDTFGAGQFQPRVLDLVEKVYTGQVPARPVARGGCTEIATGAPMPDGADAVVMVEETEHDEAGAVRRSMRFSHSVDIF